MASIRFDIVEQGIAKITVNRPEVRNALDWEAMQDFAEAVEQAASMPELRVVMITGQGEAFISGADLEAIAATPTREDGERLTTIMGDALVQLENLPAISMAIINGPSRGGGSEIAAACDLRWMAEEADLAFVHTRLGLSPGWGSAGRLLRLVGYGRALELIASARIIDAVEAKNIGLVNFVVAASELEEAALAWAQNLMENEAEAISRIKVLLKLGETINTEKMFELERELFIELWDRDVRRERFERIREGKGKKL